LKGTTHLAAGITAGASLTLALSAESAAEAFILTGASALGAILPDIDCKSNSIAVKIYKNIVTFITIIVMLYVIVKHYMHLPTNTCISPPLYYTSISISGIIFAGLCILGRLTKHRSFTHSILGLCMFVSNFYILTGKPYALAFGLGMLSHITLDLFNKRGEQLLFPLPYSFNVGIAKTNGIVDKVLGLIFSAISVILCGIIIGGF